MYKLAINIAFSPKRIDKLQYYDKLFKLMSERGFGICRIWLSDFSFNYYKYKGEVYDLDMGIFDQIIAMGKSKNIEFIPVLFDFNEFSNTNIHWEDYEHTFNTSVLHKYMYRPLNFFDDNNFGLTSSKIDKITGIFNKYNNLYAWELFNEIDHVQDFDFYKINNWTNKCVEYIQRLNSKPIFISFANPNFIGQYQKKMSNIEMAIHTYHWPYKKPFKNVIYWQSLYPDSWVMEFGDKNIDPTEALTALSASFILNNKHKVAMPWFWDDFLKLDSGNNFQKILNFLDKYIRNEYSFHFSGNLGSTGQSLNPSQVNNNFKISTISSICKKIITQLKVSFKNIFKIKMHLMFENDNYLVIFSLYNQHIPIPIKTLKLIDQTSAYNLVIKIYSKN